MWRFGLCKLHFYIYHLICLVWITSQFHATRVKLTFSFYLCEQCQIQIFECKNFIQKKKSTSARQELEKQITPLTLPCQGVIHPEYKKTTACLLSTVRNIHIQQKQKAELRSFPLHIQTSWQSAHPYLWWRTLRRKHCESKPKLIFKSFLSLI